MKKTSTPLVSPAPPTDRLLQTAGVLLGLLPVLSFALQYAMSVSRGTETQLLRHYTVTYVDWVFVPFNYLVVRMIDWRRGVAISVVAAVSVVANIAAHAAWQYHQVDGGHMISAEQVVLPAGWVHLGFSIIEATLILAFVFARKPSARPNLLATTLAITYFVGAGVSGYVMNHAVIATDAIMVTSGICLVVSSSIFNASRFSAPSGRPTASQDLQQ